MPRTIAVIPAALQSRINDVLRSINNGDAFTVALNNDGTEGSATDFMTSWACSDSDQRAINSILSTTQSAPPSLTTLMSELIDYQELADSDPSTKIQDTLSRLSKQHRDPGTVRP